VQLSIRQWQMLLAHLITRYFRATMSLKSKRLSVSLRCMIFSILGLLMPQLWRNRQTNPNQIFFSDQGKIRLSNYVTSWFYVRTDNKVIHIFLVFSWTQKMTFLLSDVTIWGLYHMTLYVNMLNWISNKWSIFSKNFSSLGFLVCEHLPLKAK
jgi:hypothetical protein